MFWEEDFLSGQEGFRDVVGLEGWENFRLKMGSVGLLGEITTPREWQRQRVIRSTVGKVSVMETWRKHWEERSGTCGKLWFLRQWSCLNVFEERTLNRWLYVGWTGRRENIRGNVSISSALYPIPDSPYFSPILPLHKLQDSQLLNLVIILHSYFSTPICVQVFRILNFSSVSLLPIFIWHCPLCWYFCL